ncbi:MULTISPECIES: hypothetical protein [Paraburkholderia]|uniref:hypothetical protein n=1 Tax=Paraburkholderia TaxID=1822464 RepID=UPI002252BCA9|nr:MULTISPECIES: hypothetical protein [Paraburkholderia]MCX4160362.1 hypothetical protein [Paraburkholderia megapolitana]MDN7155861.1 hypothetical protein [Paraburkholderia sp. CHISQ3]MDQ6492905.1 hypothetical protein [Paraburkholderia megapolitana]
MNHLMTMMSSSGAGFAQQAVAMRRTALVRKITGFAIVGSGFAVIFAHGLQHLVGA